GQELGDRRTQRAVLLNERPDEAPGAVLLGELGERVEFRARQFAWAGVEAEDGARSCGEGAGEDLKVTAGNGTAQILELETETAVRAVRAPATHRFGPG